MNRTQSVAQTTTPTRVAQPENRADNIMHPQAPVAVGYSGNQASLRLMRKCDCAGAPDCDCDVGDDKKKKEKDSPKTGLHRAAASASAPDRVPNIVGETLRSPGQTLDPQTKAFFETRFGQDFSGVRIHTDTRAAQSARAVNALAYTVGSDIAFASGRYAPDTGEGRRLLAHELSHTVQQRDATSGTAPTRISSPNEPEERAADAAAATALNGDAVAAPTAQAQTAVQRAPDPAPAANAQSPATAQPGTTQPGTAAPGAAQPAAAQRAAAAQPAAAAPTPGQSAESRKIAEFDSDSGSKRPWNLKQLTTDIFTAITASDRAFVRILGVYPTKAGEDTPQAAALDRAQLVERALIQWLGPKIPESKYDTGISGGSVGDPQVQVWISYKPGSVSNPQSGLPAEKAPAKPAPPLPVAGAINYAWHANATGPKGTSKDRTIQLTVGDSKIVQLSYNVDTKQTQVLGGYQATQDVPLPDGFLNLVNNWVKVQTFEQILAGVAAGGTTPSGSIAIVQPSVGGQVVFGKGNATVSIQVAGSVTAASAGPTTAEVNVTPTFSFGF